MAKDKGKKTEKVESKKEAAPEFKYGVQDLADKLGVEPAQVRVKLRNAGVEKAGKSYGWNTKADLDEVIDQLKGDDKPAKKSKKTEDAPKAEKKAKKAKKAKPVEDDEDEDDDDDD